MPKAKKAKKASETKLTWLPKKTFELEFSLSWPKVEKAYNEVLKIFAGKMTIKGFRKGKAPLRLVEKNLDQQRLYQEVLNQLLPETYSQALKQHNLKPIMPPKLVPLAIKKEQDWRFKAVSCEAPEVKLENYQQLLRQTSAKENIWTPNKGKPDTKKETKKSYDERLNQITKILTENINVDLPDILIEDELNRMLTRLLDQVNKLGMTIDQYLASKQTTSEQLRQGYRKTAEIGLRFEFILQAIINDRKIKIEDSDVDKMIKATPDANARKKLNTPVQRAYVGSILAKRKALDYLTSL